MSCGGLPPGTSENAKCGCFLRRGEVLAFGGLCGDGLDKPSSCFNANRNLLGRQQRGYQPHLAHEGYGGFWGAWVLDYGKAPPLYDYYVLLLWKLLPSASAMVILRIASTLCNMGTVWLLYLAGKEIGGRKTGILAAALGAISKPLLQYCLMNITLNFIPFCAALDFLFFFRLMKKPDMKHFLQWGAAVSFSSYSCNYIRHFIPLFLFGAFVWVYFQNKGRGLEKPIGRVMWATATMFLIFFLYTNCGFPYDNWIARVIDVSGPFLPCLAVGCLCLLTVAVLPRLVTEKNSKWFGWLAGSWLCVILCFPLMANDTIMARVNFFAVVPGQGVLSIPYLLKTFEQAKASLLVLFWKNTGDVMNTSGDSFFSFCENIVIALGLAFFFAKPNWKSFFIFITAIFGILPAVILTQVHTGRLLGCITPFFLLGALGLNSLLNGISLLPKGRVLYGMACVLLFGFWLWSAQTAVSKIYDQWSESILSKHVLASQEAYQDQRLGCRIYFGATLYGGNASPINEGNKIFCWTPPNIIELAPNDKPQDIAVIFEPDSRDDKGQPLKDRLTQEFPNAQWKELQAPWMPLSYGPVLWRCLIPVGDISPSPGLSRCPALFDIRTAPVPNWDRQFSNGYFGLLFDLIDYEDKVTNVGDPSPRTLGGEAVRYNGIIHVNSGGSYVVDWKIANRTELKIDNRTLLNLYFPQTNKFGLPWPEKIGSKSIHLDAGDHQVEVITCFQQSLNAPDISLLREGTPAPGQSLWSSFNF